MTKASLLPEGLRDRLPPVAEAAARVNRAILDVLASHGYARVAPPIAEFRETLDGDGSDAVAGAHPGRDLLRFTDPVSQRTIAIRPDMTTQIGRIAATRLALAPRPLRLCYSGQVMKLRPSQLRPDREMLQVGAELIGRDSVEAACEIVMLAVEALAATCAGPITVDITMPDLVAALATRDMPLPSDLVGAVQGRLDAKDAGGLAALGPAASAYMPMIHAAGNFDKAHAVLRDLSGGPMLAERLMRVAIIAQTLAGKAHVTLDPTERHGFEYQSWFGFSLFVAGHSGAVGRGGSYAIMHPGRHGTAGNQETATGFSLYPDPLIDAGLGNLSIVQRLFVPIGSDADKVSGLRANGWVTIAQLSEQDDPAALGCTHHMGADGPVSI